MIRILICLMVLTGCKSYEKKVTTYKSGDAVCHKVFKEIVAIKHMNTYKRNNEEHYSIYFKTGKVVDYVPVSVLLDSTFCTNK